MKKKMNVVAGIQPMQGTNAHTAQPAVGTKPTVATRQPTVSTQSTVKESVDQLGAGKLFGHIRVSSREQNEARQVVALREFGITDDCIFLDKQSGKDFNRPAYQALLRQLTVGDVLVVKSIDRLGRNYEEILAQWRVITKVMNRRLRHRLLLPVTTPVLVTTRTGMDRAAVSPAMGRARETMLRRTVEWEISVAAVTRLSNS